METWTQWLKESFQKNKSEEQGQIPTNKRRMLFILICVGALMLFLNRWEDPLTESTTGLEADISLPFNWSSDQGYEKELEQRLESWLSTISGVGAVKVMVVMERAEEHIYSVDTTEKRSQTEESSTTNGEKKFQTEINITNQHVIMREDQMRVEKPLVKTVLAPKVGGVVVTAQGASDPGVCYKITTALQSLLGIGAHRISVLEKE